MSIVSRRTLLLGAGGVVVLGAAGLGASAIGCGWSEARAAGAERLFVAIGDIVDPAAIGAAYASVGSAERIARELLEREDLLAAARRSCPETRRSLVGQSFRDDFRRGDIVVVNRWVVSRSECIVSALWIASGAPAPDPSEQP